MRKIFLFSTLVGVAALLWYLFILPYDYKVTFSVKTFPGTVNQSIKLWNNTLDSAKIINQISISSLEQQLKVGNHTYSYKWEMNMINDSTSNVKVYISEPENSLINKISIPFVATEIEQYAKKNVTEFYDRLNEHLDKIKVKVEGVSEIERTYCIYIPLTTTQIGKARAMMNYYSLLNSFIMRNGIQTNGLPFVEITNWDIGSDTIKYNFCYPIIKTDTLPNLELLKYKWLEHTTAIKAIYNGNYITSDRAWYALMYYAEKHGIEVINKPIEVYHTNPNFGGNEKEWQADIYLPIK
jgi:effector-binding domain-containing protein